MSCSRFLYCESQAFGCLGFRVLGFFRQKGILILNVIDISAIQDDGEFMGNESVSGRLLF